MANHERWVEGGVVADHEINFTNDPSWAAGVQGGVGGALSPHTSLRLAVQVPSAHHDVHLSRYRMPQVNQDYATQTSVVSALVGYQFGRGRVRVGLLGGGGVMLQRAGYAETPVGGTPHATLHSGDRVGVATFGAEVDVKVSRRLSVVPQVMNHSTMYFPYIFEYQYPRAGVTARWRF